MRADDILEPIESVWGGSLADEALVLFKAGIARPRMKVATSDERSAEAATR